MGLARAAALGIERWARGRAGGASLGQRFAASYLVADLRTLALFRIVFGVLLSANTIRHWLVAETYYSNAGVLTNHAHLFRPAGGWIFSLLHAFSTPAEVHVFFAAALLCHVALCLGYRTRLFQILSFIAVTSIDSRLILVENGGYIVLNLLAAWSMFLPLGARCSVDALRESLRRRRERTAAELNDRTGEEALARPHVSLAALIVVLQLATIYYFNVAHKSGRVWRAGETVHYVLHLDRMVTPLAVFLRENLPLSATRLLTYTTLIVEAALVALILAPGARRVTRPVALALMVVLHTAFGLVFRLGPFSWALIAWGVLLLEARHWDAITARLARRAVPTVVRYDAGSPLALRVVRLLRRMDRLERLRFEEAPATSDLLETRDPGGGEARRGARAVEDLLLALPGGLWARPLVRFSGMRALAALALAAMGQRRAGLSRFFGLERDAPAAPVRGPSPLGLRARRAMRILREGALAGLALCAVSQVLVENKGVPRWLKPPQPRLVEAIVQYPRMFQGWSMFAPNPITEDGTLVVDARTRDGRRIDPLTGRAPNYDLEAARSLGLNQIEGDYMNRIRLEHNRVYRQGLTDYLLAYPTRTGRREDELVDFEVFWVRDECPPPGELRPRGAERQSLLAYRRPETKDRSIPVAGR